MKEAIMALDGGGSNLRLLVVDRQTDQELYFREINTGTNLSTVADKDQALINIRNLIISGFKGIPQDYCIKGIGLSSAGTEIPENKLMLEAVVKSAVKKVQETSAVALASGTDFTPNDILAIEYLKSIDKYNLKITPFTVKREGEGYDSENTADDFISAKGCRKLIGEKDLESLKKYMPAFEVYKQALEDGRYTNPDILGTFFAGLIRTGRIDLANTAYVTEGIENRIEKAAQEYGSLYDIASAVKTKRYTHTRIMRIITCMMMGLTKEKLDDFVSTGARYIRVLAADETGTALMKEIKKKSDLPIVTNLGGESINEMLAFDVTASNLLSVAMINKDFRKANEDYTHFFERI